MNVDVSKKLKALNGQILKDVDAEGNPIDATVKIAIVNAILSPVQNEAGVEKVKKYELAKKVHTSKVVDLDEGEIKLIKDRVGETFPPIIVGQVFELLKV